MLTLALRRIFTHDLENSLCLPASGTALWTTTVATGSPVEEAFIIYLDIGFVQQAGKEVGSLSISVLTVRGGS
jgi:hypothetical protein